MKRQLCLATFILLSPMLQADQGLLRRGDPVLIPGTQGRFDYLDVDPSLRRLLVSHTENRSVDVVNLPDGKLIKSIPLGKIQGVVADATREKYYATASAEKKLMIVDRHSLTKTGEIDLPGEPDGLVFDPTNGLLYVGHDDAKDLWVIDPQASKIVGTIEIPEGPESVVYDAAINRVFQNVKSVPVVLAIDPVRNQVVNSWSTKPAEKPHGLAIDVATHRLFSAGANGKLVMMDGQTGQNLDSADILSGVDQIAYDPVLRWIYCPSGRNNGLTVVQNSTDALETLGNVATPSGVHTIAVDPETHTVWVVYAVKSGEAFVLPFYPVKKG